jgi:RND family efflux transporter MFP subunit
MSGLEAKNADLSVLRIDRAAEPAAGGSPAPRARRWSMIGLTAAGVAVLAAILLWTSGALRSAVSVRLTPATMVSPLEARAALIASGYVVAQRKAAVASKGTGRLVYLGVVEGDRVRAGQVIARIEDADVRAQLAQAEANLALSRADLRDAERSLERERILVDSGATSQARFDAAEARYQRVQAGIAIAQAAVQAAQVALENTVVRAPFDGTVLTKNADVGEVVAPLAGSAFSKSAVVTVADLRSLQVEADVAESNLEAVGPGQPCEIVLDAYPDVRYPGLIAKIVPTADRAKATVQVKIAFHSYDARILPEMSAKVLGMAITVQDREEELPADTVALWQTVLGLAPDVRQQFLEVASMWQLSLMLHHEYQTASFAFMVASCEALKPRDRQFRDHNVYHVVEALLGKPAAKRRRSAPSKRTRRACACKMSSTSGASIRWKHRSRTATSG